MRYFIFYFYYTFGNTNGYDYIAIKAERFPHRIELHGHFQGRVKAWSSSLNNITTDMINFNEISKEDYENFITP